MNLTNGEIFNAGEPLSKLMEHKFPVKISFGLAELAQKISPRLQIINDVRNGLIKTYGKKNKDNPQEIRVNPEDENFLKFIEEMNELLTQEVEIVFDKVKLPEDLEIEPSVLILLDKFVEV